MYKIGEREMVFCPYNRYHIVSKLRIQNHIIKCQKNYPEIKLATCFYNYSHRLKPEDMLKHYEICSHKTRLEGSRYYESDNLHDSSSVENTDPYTEKFPDINAKPIFFTNPVKASSFSKPKVCDFPDNSNSSEESESDYIKLKAKHGIKTEFSRDEFVDYDDKTLTSPKTDSKSDSKISVHQGSDKFTSQAFPYKKFGRGKYLMGFSSLNPVGSSDTHHDSDAVETHKQKINESNFLSEVKSTSIIPSVLEFDYILKAPKSFSRTSSASLTTLTLNDEDTSKSESQLLSNSSLSLTSSMLEDGNPLNSEEISFDEDSTEQSESDDKIIVKNFREDLKI